MTISKKKKRGEEKNHSKFGDFWVLFFFHGKYPLYDEPYYLDFFCHQVAKFRPKKKKKKRD
jgi:hypothetical protein